MPPLRLVYHLPPLGNASLTLHAESAELFRAMELLGEVDRLKRLDHLGLIRVAYGGAHHPRWEYVVTTLNLIEHCRDAPETHLRTGVRLGTGREVSSAEELLRCWALLLNIGHLAGTFSTERALMFELWRNRRLRDEFLELLQQAPCDSGPKEYSEADASTASRRLSAFFSSMRWQPQGRCLSRRRNTGARCLPHMSFRPTRRR